MDQNQCYHLPITYEEAPQLEELLAMQESLQKRILPEFDIKNPNRPLQEIARIAIDQQYAASDECHEFIAALGGTHDQGPRSAVWKWWKKDNLNRNMTFGDLSERDQIEAKMELVDRFHFFMNEMLLIGMTGSELVSMYKAKNAENFNRQDNNY